MQLIDNTIKFLKSEKERVGASENIKISFQDIQTELRHKASTWITFGDGSGELKLYEEDFSDIDWSGIGSDALKGGLALLIPGVGSWISAGIVGSRAARLVQSGKKTYIFVFNALEKCVFAIEICSREFKYSLVKEILERVEDFFDYEDDDVCGEDGL